jgi:hypothetical protein
LPRPDCPGNALYRLVHLVGGVYRIAQHESWCGVSLAVPGKRMDEHAGLQYSLGEIRIRGVA